MNNLISKSQSLFLVAILAIFPSANAINEADIEEKLQEISNNFELIYDNFNKFNERLSKLEREQGRQEEPRKFSDMFYKSPPYYRNEEAMYRELDYAGANRMNQEEFNKQWEKNIFNSDFNPGTFSFEEISSSNQGEKIVNELNPVENRMNYEDDSFRNQDDQMINERNPVEANGMIQEDLEPIVSNRWKKNRSLLDFNSGMSEFDKIPSYNHGFNSDLSLDFNSGTFGLNVSPSSNQVLQMIVKERNPVAAKRMNRNEFLKTLLNYLEEYKNANRSEKGELTIQFKNDIANKINDTGLTKMRQVNSDVKEYIKENLLNPMVLKKNLLNPMAIREIKKFLANR